MFLNSVSALRSVFLLLVIVSIVSLVDHNISSRRRLVVLLDILMVLWLLVVDRRIIACS